MQCQIRSSLGQRCAIWAYQKHRCVYNTIHILHVYVSYIRKCWLTDVLPQWKKCICLVGWSVATRRTFLNDSGSFRWLDITTLPNGIIISSLCVNGSTIKYYMILSSEVDATHCTYKILICLLWYELISDSYSQGCGNIEPTARHFDLFSPLVSCSPYTLYTVQFQFTRHSLDLSDNVLYNWLFPHTWL